MRRINHRATSTTTKTLCRLVNKKKWLTSCSTWKMQFNKTRLNSEMNCYRCKIVWAKIRRHHRRIKASRKLIEARLCSKITWTTLQPWSTNLKLNKKKALRTTTSPLRSTYCCTRTWWSRVVLVGRWARDSQETTTPNAYHLMELASNTCTRTSRPIGYQPKERTRWWAFKQKQSLIEAQVTLSKAVKSINPRWTSKTSTLKLMISHSCLRTWCSMTLTKLLTTSRLRSQSPPRISSTNKKYRRKTCKICSGRPRERW